MNLAKRITLAGTVVATLVTGVFTTATYAGGLAPAVRTNSICAVQYIIGQQKCYAPSRVAEAQRQVPWAVSPTSAMNLTFGLKLSQVSVVTLPGFPVKKQIDYLYGPLRHDYGRQAAGPIAIRVTEFNHRENESRFQPQWTHTICGMKIELSPAADPQRRHPNYGPWYLIGNFPQGNRSFGIVGNSGPKMLETLACRLVGMPVR